jgi:hypothetical protein
MYDQALRNFHIEQQNMYRDCLDNQLKQDKEPNLRRNRSVNIVGSNLPSNNRIVNNLHITNKNINLPDSTLEHNPILNPIPDFKHNKYLYRNGNSLKLAGNSIIL